MKIVKKNKLLKLKLIKTRTYKKTYVFIHLKIEDIEHRLKKALQIIHRYHINNQKILFITSSSIIKINKLLQNTKHIVINNNLWSNKQTLSPFQTLKSKIKYNLIVILEKLTDSNIINESYKKKIPIVSIGDDLNIFNNKLNYKVPGNFAFRKKKIREDLFLILLKNIFKRLKKKQFKKYDSKKKK